MSNNNLKSCSRLSSDNIKVAPTEVLHHQHSFLPVYTTIPEQITPLLTSFQDKGVKQWAPLSPKAMLADPVHSTRVNYSTTSMEFLHTAGVKFGSWRGVLNSWPSLTEVLSHPPFIPTPSLSQFPLLEQITPFHFEATRETIRAHHQR